MKQEIAICDVCKKTVADRKCSICEKDCCDNPLCGRDVNIQYGTGVVLATMYRCHECGKRLRRGDYDDVIDNEMQQKILTNLAKRFALENMR